MQRFENIVRRLTWNMEKLLNKPKRSIAPVQWMEARHVELPTSQMTSQLDDQQMRRLEFVKKEVQLLSQLLNLFPSRLVDQDWKTLLECSTRKQRLDQLVFLRKRELLKEQDKRKKMERTREAHTQLRERSDNFLFNFNIPRIEQEIRQQDWCRVAAAHRLGAPKIAVDCRFLAQLSPRGADLTALQLKYLVSENMRRRSPWQLFFVNFDGSNGRFNHLRNKHLAGADSPSTSSPVIINDNYTSLADKQKIVYLSPHADETLTSVDDDKVYVLGGIVDRVSEKGIASNASRVAADEDGVTCYKLPLDEHIKWESGTKYLTLNAVMAILQDTFDTNDWSYSIRKNIPTRNVKPPAEKSHGIRDKHERIREYNRRIMRIVERKIGSEY